jgi:hypothetical protein
MKSGPEKREKSDQDTNPETEINKALERIIEKARRQNKALIEVLKKIDPGYDLNAKR